MSKTEKECKNLIELGQKEGNMQLVEYAENAFYALQSDDGTPGLGDYLWEREIIPNLKKARKIASYINQTRNVVNTTRILAKRHKNQRNNGRI